VDAARFRALNVIHQEFFETRTAGARGVGVGNIGVRC
jgi:hypothetical protein